jgi:phosphomannomutase / phosphoglucomutase
MPHTTYQLPHTIPSNIFRLYDIRGIAGEELNENVYYAMGLSIASTCREHGESTLVVGRDGRCTSPVFQEALIQGAREAGMDVIDIGLVPTGALYFAVHHLPLQSGVMVTGSHNPAHHNGIKTMIQGKTLSAEGVQQLKQRYKARNFTQGEGDYLSHTLLPAYVETVAHDIHLKKKMHVVIDAGNGAGGVIAQALFEKLGCQVTPLHCRVDGTFPNHHPDPTIEANLQDLIHKVREVGADCGLAFDGDADRLGVVTNEGTIIWPDRLMMLFAQDVLKSHPGSKIIFDVKCSQHLASWIQQHGGKPIMWRTGHSILKAKMFEENAPLAGELSGHIFFNDGRWPGFDDGLYVGARFLACLDASKQDAETLCAALPKAFDTPELKIPLSEAQKAPVMTALAEEDYGEADVNTLDGLRITYPYGWVLIRPSNTTPCLTLRFEGNTEDDLNHLKTAYHALFQKIDPELTLPF